MRDIDGPNGASSADALAHQAVMLEVFAEPLMVQRVHIAIAGSLAAGVMLSQCGYISDALDADQDGWFTKSAQQWEEELGLTRREQEAAKQALRDLGVLTYRKVGAPARIWYHLNRERLGQLLSEHAERKWRPILERAREIEQDEEGETFVPYEERPALAGLWREWLQVRFNEEGALSANGRHDLVHGVEKGVLLAMPRIFERFVAEIAPVTLADQPIGVRSVIEAVQGQNWHVRTGHSSMRHRYEWVRAGKVVTSVHGLILAQPRAFFERDIPINPALRVQVKRPRRRQQEGD